MALVVDTNVFVTLERRDEHYEALEQSASGNVCALAAITVSELLLDAHRAESATRRARRRALIAGLTANFPVLPFDLRVAYVHAEIWAALMQSGQMIGAHDLLIAATAVANGYGVLTENARAFERVPGLVVRRPVW